METKKTKYPRTPHLPWSPGRSSDDVALADCSHFEGHAVVITEKADGENTTLYRDAIHARSLDSRHHESRSWVKQLHDRVRADIPEGWRVCGENLWARHSIAYSALPSYFLVFSIWTETGSCLSWSETETWCSLLGLEHVPVLHRGLWRERMVRSAGFLAPQLGSTEAEGYVVRLEDGFALANFGLSVAKYVRAGHVQTDEHWMHGAVEVNGLLPGPGR